MKRIVIGLDGTQKDHGIVAWIGDFATEVGAQVIAAHFVPRASVWMIAGAQIDCDAYFDELREHFDDDVLVPLQARIGAVPVHVQAGDPARELAAIAHRSAADLIAIGAPDHTAVHDVVFGSGERRLLHLADVPVISVPSQVRHMRLVR
jgi:nucleotide-binding universal stress UspA family protein